jgi:hypothetical protein
MDGTQDVSEDRLEPGLSHGVIVMIVPGEICRFIVADGNIVCYHRGDKERPGALNSSLRVRLPDEKKHHARHAAA